MFLSKSHHGRLYAFTNLLFITCEFTLLVQKFSNASFCPEPWAFNSPSLKDTFEETCEALQSLKGMKETADELVLGSKGEQKRHMYAYISMPLHLADLH